MGKFIALRRNKCNNILLSIRSADSLLHDFISLIGKQMKYEIFFDFDVFQ